MKKLLFLICTTLLMISCGSDDSLSGGDVILPKTTEVKFESSFVDNGECSIARSGTFSSALVSNVNMNALAEPGYKIPNENGQHNVFFYIRIDGSVPGVGDDCNVDKYFPRDNSKKSPTTINNHGFVNDSLDNDGHVIAWKKNKSFDKYLFTDPDGMGENINKIISDVPTIAELVAANTKKGDDLSYLIPIQDDLHIIWYKCKQQVEGWHIDGILTTKDRESINVTDFIEDIKKSNPDEEIYEPKDLPGNIEVDVHEQVHKDWNEIKTTIHIRDTVNTKVILPIDNEYLIDQDDFLIRTYEAYYTIDNVKYPIDVIIAHNDKDLTIDVTGITATILEDASEITIEVHSYYTGITHDILYEKLKGVVVKTYPDRTTIYGQVHKQNDPKSEWVPIGKGFKE